MKRIRAAVVGAGLMGRWHGRYAMRAGADLVAIVDPRPDAAAALEKRLPGSRAFGDLRECLEACSVDVVHVCSDAETHGALVEKALLGGAHVLVEKPAAGSRSQLVGLLELARQRGLTLTATHQLPFQRGFRILKEKLGSLGELLSIRYVLCTAGGDVRPAEERSSLLFEMLPHPFSLARALLGGALAPGSLQVAAPSDAELQLTGSAGETRMEVSISLRGRPTRHELTVTGTAGSAWLDLFHGYCVFEQGLVSRRAKLLRPFRLGTRMAVSAGVNLLYRAVGREPAFPGLLELVRLFYEAVATGGPSPVGEDEMVGSLALIEAVRSRIP